MATVTASRSVAPAFRGAISSAASPVRVRSGEGVSLLRYSTPQERALELAVERAFTVEVPIRDLSDADAAAPHLLPWLAFDVSVDYWRPEWTDAQKRAAIRVSDYVHRHKGTIGGVKAAVGALTTGAIVRELGPAQPFRGEVLVNVHGENYTEGLADEIDKVVEASKNARTVMDIRLYADLTGSSVMSAASHIVETLRVFPAE